ncbi:hypothetical protein DL96DRAFT_1031181 [Flagelloscypha sp. PMI_526]|nr:hypothetical protein DL96DRAFT_1031181 [Flagelloscypha sp. PMI_526]
MAAPVDDLPWPELGNVSRGATRGNQGQKGVLGPPDEQGRCMLQLRVQPGVLAVRLNRKASDWYRTLDAEVNRALKLTKTYWRKARRRQDYDARADQDHMELHEWLQQLKDKTMSHLEVLMQRGDIKGTPFTMDDDTELTFLRMFIERQAAGIPHNPRLRNPTGGVAPYVMHHHPTPTDSPSPASETGFAPPHLGVLDHGSESSGAGPSRASRSPTLRAGDALSAEASSSKQILHAARAGLSRAEDNTRRAFNAYTAALEEERQARQAVTAAEKRRDDVMAMLASRNPLGLPESGSRHSSPEEREDPLAQRYTPEDLQPPPMGTWGDVGPERMYGAPAPSVSPAFDNDPGKVSRKHPRSWEQPDTLQDGYTVDDLMPPRKRVQTMPPYDQSSFTPSASLPANIPLP